MAQVDDYDAALGARTQSLFRQVNVGVRQINEAFSDFLPHGDWSCECANPSCDLRIALTADEYERIRSQPTHFAVAAGDVHVFHPIESVLERHPNFWVVAKRGKAAELATRVDPRRVAVSSG